MPRAEREQLILDVAGRVFARDGYHAAAMDEIARLADVSKPMLYTYFGSKEGLYVAYIERTGQELLERLGATLGDPGASLAHLRARVGDFLAFVEEHRDGWRVLFNEASSNRPIAEQVAELRRRIADTVMGQVQAALEGRGTLAPGAEEVVAHAIVGAGESLANWWLEHPELSRERLAEWYAEVIRGAVGALIRRG
jgi:AcrR family transcriptional regulator